jgi:glycerol-3-phosphate cytidylyltransferase
MKKVITYGTFDTLHYGHILLLRRARALGDHLTVALSTDGFNAIKKKTSRLDYEVRKGLLEAITYVDEIIPEENWEQKRSDVTAHNIDIFTMGDDWEGEFDFLSDLCQVVYLGRTPSISSTAIKKITATPHLSTDPIDND